ncbi:MAG: hypothetical protein J6J11_08145 [Treponema sp.]|nr:hypothetical protein [Clostridia bacterium]MBP3608273.1 hypothetical protein [Treponema sp.]
MRKYKNKIKKILYKTIPCIVCFIMIFSCFSLSAESVYIENSTWSNTMTFFTEINGSFDYRIIQTGTTGGSIWFPINSNYWSATGDFYFLQSNFYDQALPFDPNSYYIFYFPISININPALSVNNAVMEFVSPNGTIVKGNLTDGALVDPASPSGYNYHTIYFKFIIDGSLITTKSKFRLSLYGTNSQPNDYFESWFVLLDGSYYTLTVMSDSEYNSLYGSSSKPIVPDSDNDIAHFESVEEELYGSANVDGVKVFFENIENAELFTPLQSASMLFSELYNFGGTRTTIFESIAIFSLALGLVVLLIAIAPRLVSGGKKK